MKKTVLFAGVICFLVSSIATANYTQINYALSDLGQGRWLYSYEISSQLVPGLQEVTIDFAYGLYTNLQITSSPDLATSWDQIVVQPDPVFGGQKGFYDVLAKGNGIAQGSTVAGFAVSFQWLGKGLPGSQSYKIVDPVTFETIESGQTVPEPCVCSLVILGSLYLRRFKQTKAFVRD